MRACGWSRRPKSAAGWASRAVPAVRLRADAPRRRLGPRLLLRPNHQHQDPEDPGHHRRVHQEALAIEVDRSITADHTVAVLEAHRGLTGRTPEHLRMDNGTEMTATRHSATGVGSRPPPPATSNPGTPGRTRSSSRSPASCAMSCSTSRPSQTLLEAKILAEDFRIDYNTYRPHSSLGYRTPVSFAAEWAEHPAGVT